MARVSATVSAGPCRAATWPWPARRPGCRSSCRPPGLAQSRRSAARSSVPPSRLMRMISCASIGCAQYRVSSAAGDAARPPPSTASMSASRLLAPKRKRCGFKAASPSMPATSPVDLGVLHRPDAARGLEPGMHQAAAAGNRPAWWPPPPGWLTPAFCRCWFSQSRPQHPAPAAWHGRSACWCCSTPVSMMTLRASPGQAARTCAQQPVTQASARHQRAVGQHHIHLLRTGLDNLQSVLHVPRQRRHVAMRKIGHRRHADAGQAVGLRANAASRGQTHTAATGQTGSGRAGTGAAMSASVSASFRLVRSRHCRARCAASDKVRVLGMN
jgi:hypothetical protein